jgi:hypothetical protein
MCFISTCTHVFILSCLMLTNKGAVWIWIWQSLSYLEIPWFSRNPKDYHCFQKTVQLECMLSPLNPADRFTYLFNILFNIIVASACKPPIGLSFYVLHLRCHTHSLHALVLTKTLLCFTGYVAAESGSVSCNWSKNLQRDAKTVTVRASSTTTKLTVPVSFWT